MKTFAIDIIGQKEPTFISESDVIKLVKNTNNGARLVLVGQSFINPSSIARIRRVYGVESDIIEKTDEELVKAIENPDIKRLT